MTKILAAISFSEGETWRMSMTFYEADGATPLDLTGAEVEWAVAAAMIDTPIASFDTATGIVIDADPTSGKAEMSIAPAAHAALLPGAYVHQARVVLSDGTALVQFEGALTVRESLFVAPV